MRRSRAGKLRTSRCPMTFASISIALFALQAASQSPRSRDLLLELAAEPRLAGTSGGLQGAKVAAKALAAAGWRVEIDEREVMLSLPRRISVRLFEKAGVEQPFEARVERFDADALPPGDVPLYNAWTASGKVRAKVVDVGFGLRADYEALAQQKIDVRGAIALARYGRAYRGVKVDLAAEHGCVGLLLFTESASDGGERGTVWPEGPWKPDWDGQRGSILPIASAPGDPSTPNGPSLRPGERTERLSLDELEAKLPKIPCTPIGAREAKLVLARLQSVGERRIGPGPVEVELDLDVPRELRTIRNVVATLDGAQPEGELVIAGGHRDAWVRGANDNASGCVALIRAAQQLGERSKSGWKPARTLKIGLWDAEEFGLIGSTEWGEANAELLRRRCVAYVNCDASIAGTAFSGGGSPGMLRMLRASAERLSVPGTNTNLCRTGARAPKTALRSSDFRARARITRCSHTTSASPWSSRASAATPAANTTLRSTTTRWCATISIRAGSATSSRDDSWPSCSPSSRTRRLPSTPWRPLVRLQRVPARSKTSRGAAANARNDLRARSRHSRRARNARPPARAATISIASSTDLRSRDVSGSATCSGRRTSRTATARYPSRRCARPHAKDRSHSTSSSRAS